uniref:Bm13114, isoform b n=1 Tax=Brugia malayi TaxID=6279 RepID=A0A0J9XVP3_BRUMA|nr:Bm13114, isoform b [Brugia malayi]
MVLFSVTFGSLLYAKTTDTSGGSYQVHTKNFISVPSNVCKQIHGAGKKADLAVSLGSCFASGIFLSSCFLGLLPHIRKHEEHIRNMWISTVGHTDSSSYIFLNSELVVLMIFLLILFLEELF